MSNIVSSASPCGI